MEERVKIFFESLSYNSDISILEEGKSKDELESLFSKRGIEYPSKDLAAFKCKYAMVNEENGNGCTLPKKEVKKALKTLAGKAVDKDHKRKEAVGVWLDADLKDDDTIYAYGAFWKSNFPEEYAIIKDRIEQGKMKISFEAWGIRKYKENGKSYELTEIEFSGGALLFDSQPAFPEAEILDFASINQKVLEFAKVIEEKLPEKETGFEMNDMEEAKLQFNWDDSTIARLMSECECPSCKERGWYDVNDINFDEGTMGLTCGKCKSKIKASLLPQTTLVKRGQKIEKATQKGGKEVDELLQKYNKGSIADFSKFVDELQKSIGDKDTELATVKEQLSAKSTELESTKTELASIRSTLDAKITAEKVAVIASRKAELGEEFTKDMKDEDILDDVKFELAKTKKELATVKEQASKGTKGLEAGATTNLSQKDKDVFALQERLHKKAFGE